MEFIRPYIDAYISGFEIHERCNYRKLEVCFNARWMGSNVLIRWACGLKVCYLDYSRLQRFDRGIMGCG